MGDIKLCLDCKWSIPEENAAWILQCTHPKVIKSHANTLSAPKRNIGPSCFETRSQPWPFDKCGRRGKLWSTKGGL